MSKTTRPILAVFFAALLWAPPAAALAAAKARRPVLHPKAVPLPFPHQGPFVTAGDGGVLCVDSESALHSRDEGRTWTTTPIFRDRNKYRISNEQALLRTRDGVVIAAWMNLRLSIAFSSDESVTWSAPKVVAANYGPGGRVSYPYLYERRPGELWITTMQGGLRMRINAADLDAGEIPIYKPPAPLPPKPAEYEQNLRWMIATLRQHNAKPILMTTNPTRWTSKLRELYGKPPYRPEDADGFDAPVLARYNETVRKLAQQLSVPLVDIHAGFTAKKADKLLLDGMHPNDEGHRLVAELLVPVIREQLR
jgi:hypothetical protein